MVSSAREWPEANLIHRAALAATLVVTLAHGLVLSTYEAAAQDEERLSAKQQEKQRTQAIQFNKALSELIEQNPEGARNAAKFNIQEFGREAPAAEGVGVTAEQLLKLTEEPEEAPKPVRKVAEKRVEDKPKHTRAFAPSGLLGRGDAAKKQNKLEAAPVVVRLHDTVRDSVQHDAVQPGQDVADEEPAVVKAAAPEVPRVQAPIKEKAEVKEKAKEKVDGATTWEPKRDSLPAKLVSVVKPEREVPKAAPRQIQIAKVEHPPKAAVVPKKVTFEKRTIVAKQSSQQNGLVSFKPAPSSKPEIGEKRIIVPFASAQPRNSAAPPTALAFSSASRSAASSSAAPLSMTRVEADKDGSDDSPTTVQFVTEKVRDEKQVPIVEERTAMPKRQIQADVKVERAAEQPKIVEPKIKVLNRDRISQPALLQASAEPAFVPARTVRHVDSSRVHPKFSALDDDEPLATVAVQRASVRTGPGYTSSALMVVTEGERFPIEMRGSVWTMVVLKSGVKAWLPSAALSFE